MSAEVWRDIPSFPLYQASSRGRIRSEFRVRKLQIDDDGYFTVDLYVGGSRSKQRVNRLVCEAFHGPAKYPSIMDAAHKDGRKANNRAGNLYWATKKQNAADALRHGTRVHGDKHPLALFTRSQVSIIRAQHSHQPGAASIKRLADAFEVSPTTIRDIVAGRSWSTPQPKRRRA